MIRVGIGYDSHRFEAGRPFILGGQRIAFEKGLIGHSDADAVSHAVIDALLGAAGIGDLGALFPGELGIPPDGVGIKAKTNEGMGFVGRGEGVAVFAVATVEER